MIYAKIYDVGNSHDQTVYKCQHVQMSITLYTHIYNKMIPFKSFHPPIHSFISFVHNNANCN